MLCPVELRGCKIDRFNDSSHCVPASVGCPFRPDDVFYTNIGTFALALNKLCAICFHCF